MGTDPATDSREGVCLIDERDGLLITALCHEREVARDILADGTGIDAFGLEKV
jgi:hypothetical protein